MKWDDATSLELKALAPSAVVVVPVASIEQHGPHLPVGTDSFITEGVAARMDEACGDRLLVLPVLRFGCSDHHMAFCGTLSVKHETFAAVVMEVLGSIVHHGFRRILLLNGHGGNAAIGGVIAERAAREWPEAEVVMTNVFRVASEPISKIIQGTYPAVGHACEFETSVMLALKPELVRMNLAEDDGLPPAAPHLRGDMLRGPVATLALPFHKVTRRGVFGRPTLATEEKGRRFLDVIVSALRDLVVGCWPDALLKPLPPERA